MKLRHLALSAAASVLAMQGMAAETHDMGGMKNQPAAARAAAKPAQGIGIVKAIDAQKGMVTIAHEPIKERNWPAMTMGFKVADPALLKNLEVGKKVQFSIEEREGPTIVAIK